MNPPDDHEARLFAIAQMAVQVLTETTHEPEEIDDGVGKLVRDDVRFAARHQAMGYLAYYFGRATAPLAASWTPPPSS